MRARWCAWSARPRPRWVHAFPSPKQGRPPQLIGTAPVLACGPITLHGLTTIMQACPCPVRKLSMSKQRSRELCLRCTASRPCSCMLILVKVGVWKSGAPGQLLNRIWQSVLRQQSACFFALQGIALYPDQARDTHLHAGVPPPAHQPGRPQPGAALRHGAARVRELPGAGGGRLLRRHPLPPLHTLLHDPGKSRCFIGI